MHRPLAQRLATAASLFLATVVLPACDALSGGDYEEQIVVSAILQVGRPLPSVQLTRTIPLGDRISPEAQAVDDAEVRISVLNGDGEIEQEYTYELVTRGTYRPVGDVPDVRPRRTYRFRAMIPGRETLVAETKTPAAIDLVSPPEDSVPYLSFPGPEITISSSSTVNRQAVYLIQIAALAPDDFEVFQRDDESFGLRRVFAPGRFGPTPDIASFIENIDCEPQGADFDCDFDPLDLSSGNSPLLNEQTYIENPDGTITVRVPWIGVSFFGPHSFILNSLDDALVAFVATQAVQFNPTTLSPGEIPNVSSNVENGLGVFGSFASVEVESTIVEQAP